MESSQWTPEQASVSALQARFWLSTVLLALVLVLLLAVLVAQPKIPPPASFPSPSMERSSQTRQPQPLGAGWIIVPAALVAIFAAVSVSLYLRVRHVEASVPPAVAVPPEAPAGTTPPTGPARWRLLRSSDLALPQQLAQFALGFGGWWLLNTLVGWVGYLLGGSDWPKVATNVGVVLFFVNILAVVLLSRWRRWVAFGVLVALAANLASTTALFTITFAACAPSPSYGCAVPFFLPMGP